MDPNVTLDAILRIIKYRDFPEWAGDYGDELADNIESLHGWLSKGGFLPDAWQPHLLRESRKGH